MDGLEKFREKCFFVRLTFENTFKKIRVKPVFFSYSSEIFIFHLKENLKQSEQKINSGTFLYSCRHCKVLINTQCLLPCNKNFSLDTWPPRIQITFPSLLCS